MSHTTTADWEKTFDKMIFFPDPEEGSVEDTNEWLREKDTDHLLVSELYPESEIELDIDKVKQFISKLLSQQATEILGEIESEVGTMFVSEKEVGWLVDPGLRVGYETALKNIRVRLSQLRTKYRKDV